MRVLKIDFTNGESVDVELEHAQYWGVDTTTQHLYVQFKEQRPPHFTDRSNYPLCNVRRWGVVDE